ncbi:MAG: thymidine kinase [Phycisphaerae bacterium]
MPGPTASESVSSHLSDTTPPTPPGTLTVILGCMFSGKTTDLLRRLASQPEGSAVAFKHLIDDRYDSHSIVTHAGKAIPGIAVAGAGELRNRIDDGIKLVAVDEGHFFCEPLADVCRELTERALDVVVTSLDVDSWGRPFRVARELARCANEIVVRHAVCGRCGIRADRTQRLTPIVGCRMVGGADDYEPRCQRCWTPPPEPPP